MSTTLVSQCVDFKKWYVHFMEYHLDIKRNKILINVAISTNRENVILTQRWPTKMPVTALLPLYRKFTIEKSIGIYWFSG